MSRVHHADFTAPRREAPRPFVPQGRTEGWPLGRLVLGVLMAAIVGFGFTWGWDAGETVPSETHSAWQAAKIEAAVAPVTKYFSLCHRGGGFNCVVDGDTIWLRGQKIRLVGIDAPETWRARCDAEFERGRKATLRLQALLNGGAVTARRVAGEADRDRYGRALRSVRVDGADVGKVLIAEGLAVRFGGGRPNWC